MNPNVTSRPPAPHDGRAPVGRRRPWTRIAVALVGVALAGLIIPGTGVVASTTLDSQVGAWASRYTTSALEETSTSIRYAGPWATATSSGYYGDKAKFANAKGARATATVTGTAVAWVGPVGPTRGKASVYVDGRFVRTVNTWASGFDATRVLFVAALNPAYSHTLSIVVQGTAGHPTVALDRFVVRGAAKPSATPGGTTSGPITVTKDHVVIDGKTIIGTGSGAGIRAHGTATNHISYLTIRNCVIKGFTIGIDLSHVDHLVIENCVIDNSRYAGILVVSGQVGRITHNTIRKVGIGVTTSSDNNAYGIALSRSATTNFTTSPRTSDFLVDRNTIEDVPFWHCLDTHAAERITFTDNVTRRCPRPVFITTDGIDSPSRNITVKGNRFEQAVSISGGTNKMAVTLVNLQTGAITGNYVSRTYGSPFVYDYLGLNRAGSTNVTISGQVAIP